MKCTANGVVALFDKKQMSNRLKSTAHKTKLADCNARYWDANYGRAPVSSSMEKIIFANFHNYAQHSIHNPFTAGSSGCGDSICQEEEAFEKIINEFHDSADFKTVCFSAQATHLITRLWFLSFGLLKGSTPNTYLPVGDFTHIVVGIGESYVASDLFRIQAQNFVIINDSESMINDLTSLFSKRLIVAIVYDHMRYTDLKVRPEKTFCLLHKWCADNNVALVCDETLSFLMREPAFSFDCGGEELPDFVIVGKFACISALLATKNAKRLFGVLAQDSLQAKKKSPKILFRTISIG